MIRALMASTAALAFITLPACAQGTDDPAPTLSLSASADIQLAPEFADVRAGVVTRAETAEAAVRGNAQAMSQAFTALRRAGVAESDMQTARLSVSPVYDNRREEGGTRLEIIGYEARNTVSARVRDTGDVGEVIDAMVSAGANSIDSVTFGAEDTDEAMDAARREAVADLLARAELFADAAGFELCGIRRMSEGGSAPQPVYAMRSMAAEAAPTPVAAGQLTLTATVSADFCISQD